MKTANEGKADGGIAHLEYVVVAYQVKIHFCRREIVPLHS